MIWSQTTSPFSFLDTLAAWLISKSSNCTQITLLSWSKMSTPFSALPVRPWTCNSSAELTPIWPQVLWPIFPNAVLDDQLCVPTQFHSPQQGSPCPLCHVVIGCLYGSHLHDLVCFLRAGIHTGYVILNLVRTLSKILYFLLYHAEIKSFL